MHDHAEDAVTNYMHDKDEDPMANTKAWTSRAPISDAMRYKLQGPQLQHDEAEDLRTSAMQDSGNLPVLQ